MEMEGSKKTANDSFFSIEQKNYDTMRDSQSDKYSHRDPPVDEWRRNKEFSSRNYVWLATSAGVFQGTQIFLLQ